MKNTYLIGYFPFIAITLFSLSFAIYGEIQLLFFMKKIGIYESMLEFFSEAGIQLALLIVLTVLFFMLFAAMKLMKDTVIEISLLLFSKEKEGTGLRSIRVGAIIYLFGGAASFTSVNSIIGLLAIFLGSSLIAFLYFVYSISTSLSVPGLIGIIFFHTFIWSALLLTIGFSCLKLYNSVMVGLPI